MADADSGPVVVFPAPAPVVVGPQGPQGPAGREGQPRWRGQGPPGTIIGAEPGDEYLDEETGTIYVNE